MKWFTSILIAVMAGLVLGQEGMPKPEIPAEFNKLAEFLTGNFKSKETWFSPDGKSHTYEATVTARKAIQGRWIETIYRAMMPQMGTMEGRMLLTWDPQDKNVKAYWFDNMEGRAMDMTGTFTNGKLILTSKEIDMPGMGKTTYRITYTPKGKSVLFLLEGTTGDKTMKVIEGEYVRLEKPAVAEKAGGYMDGSKP